MSVAGGTTTHGIPKFADSDSPDLGAGGLGSILDTLDGLIGAYKIATISGALATYDFTNIPQTFGHLALVGSLRSDNATTWDWLGVRFNNDSAGNYDVAYTNASNSTITVAEAYALTAARLGAYPGASAAANLFSSQRLLIPNYVGANNKSAEGGSVQKIGTAAGQTFVFTFGGFWRSNVAISRLTLVPAVGSFVAGSYATLVGIP